MRLHELYLDKGRPLPPGKRIRSPYKEKSTVVLYKGMKTWMRLARQSNVPEILSFCDTVERHLMGIVYHAKFPISSGKVEGVNNMIKTLRRKVYGYRDTEYFFLKIKFASMRGPYRYKSHTKL